MKSTMIPYAWIALTWNAQALIRLHHKVEQTGVDDTDMDAVREVYKALQHSWVLRRVDLDQELTIARGRYHRLRDEMKVLNTLLADRPPV